MLLLFTRILLLNAAHSRKGLRRRAWLVRAGLCISACLLVVIGMMASGCGSNAGSQAKAGPIAIANPTGTQGAVTALAIGTTAKLSMMPTGDSLNAGIDWTVVCGGDPITGSVTNGACGTLAPAHTADGGTTVFTAPSVAPIGTTVTITATVTSNPSQSSSVTLSVLSSSIAISFASAPPSSMEISTTASLRVAVTNDPNNAGVIWAATCGSAACGSFNPATSPGINLGTIYTAPASIPTGSTVTITATSLTDTTKSASATVTITGPPPPPPPPPGVAISVVPANIYVQKTGPGRSSHLTAIVTNDAAVAGVDWTLSCSTSNCGSISSHTASGGAATFTNTSTVAVGGTITITATSTTDPTKTATGTATVVTAAPVTVTISPTLSLPAALNAGATATLAATVTPPTDKNGVNWTATCGSPGACGSFNLSPAHTASGGQIIYTAPAAAPAGGVVTITAASAATTPSNADVRVTTILAQPAQLTLSFAQTPPASLVSGVQAPVSVTIKNDVAPGGVLWSAQCANTAPGACGWFVPAQTASGSTALYTAPPLTSRTNVTLTATSIAEPTVSIVSNPVTIIPNTTLSVSFIPSLPSQLQVNATVNLTASVANDTTNAGVDWQVCASGCGFFTIKPATPEIPATATTPDVPAVPAVTATSASAWPNSSPIPYTAPSQPPAAGTVAIVASAHADTTKANSGTITIGTAASEPALSGVVQAGLQPVAGASVALYAAGTGGYGSLAAQIASAAATDQNGNFTVPASYSCPAANSQMYLVATGGTVGQNEANPNLALMTALGSCSNLSSSPVVLNEATTAASAWATAPFSADDALTGNSSYLYIGTSGSNLIGLSNAFAAVNNLVDISTGKVRYAVPAQNAAVPYAEINTLADILNACTASSGGTEGDGSGCGNLFAATDLLGTGTFGSSISPSDTLQAAFNIAQHPVSNYGYVLDKGATSGNSPALVSLATIASPFQPILSAQPIDWSISLNYTSGGGLSPASMVGSFAIDNSGNLWITDTQGASGVGSVIEWNPVGAALSPSTGFAAGGGPIAIDAAGNVWISGNGALNELTSLGAPLPWSPYGGVRGGGGDIAFDALGNLWITNQDGVNEFSNQGLELSPVSGYSIDQVKNITAVGIDSSNNVWLGSSADGNTVENGYLAVLANPGGQLIADTNGAGLQYLPQMAADDTGDLWLVQSLNLCEAVPYGGIGSTLEPHCYAQGALPTSGNPSLYTFNMQGIALDGAGIVWVASQGGGAGPVIPPSVLPINPSLSNQLSAALPYASSSLAAGPRRVAIDGSGNIWVLLANNTVTEYVGAATPVVTPLALATQTKKLAAKP